MRGSIDDELGRRENSGDCYLHVIMFFSFLSGWLHMGGWVADRSMDVVFLLL
jgi:hypothetical protein